MSFFLCASSSLMFNISKRIISMRRHFVIANRALKCIVCLSTRTTFEHGQSANNVALFWLPFVRNCRCALDKIHYETVEQANDVTYYVKVSYYRMHPKKRGKSVCASAYSLWVESVDFFFLPLVRWTVCQFDSVPTVTRAPGKWRNKLLFPVKCIC